MTANSPATAPAPLARYTSTRPRRGLTKSQREKARRVRRARGVHADPQDVDSAPAVAHLRRLLGAGLSIRQVAHRAGLDGQNLARLLAGDRPRIHGRTARLLLAVDAAPDLTEPLVPAVGARRRGQALARAGWSLTWQAQQVGVSFDSYRRQLAAARIRPAVWIAIADLFDAHAHRTGPSLHAIGQATGKGWAPPNAWDEHTIDDPATRPDRGHRAARGYDEIAVERACTGERLHLHPRERREAVRRLHAGALSDDLIADRLNTTIRTVLRIRTELQLAAWAHPTEKRSTP